MLTANRGILCRLPFGAILAENKTKVRIMLFQKECLVNTVYLLFPFGKPNPRYPPFFAVFPRRKGKKSDFRCFILTVFVRIVAPKHSTVSHFGPEYRKKQGNREKHR